MNKVLKVIAFILVISFFIDKVFYFSLNNISDRVFVGQSIGKLNKYLDIKDKKDVIVFGSSRAHHHIDVNKFSKNGYNMGVDGRFIAYSSTLMKLLPKEKSQLIIIHIDPERAVKMSYNGADISALAVKFHRNKIIKNQIIKFKKSNILQWFYWCIDYNGKTLGIIENAIRNDNFEQNNGFSPIKVTAIQKEVFQNILLKERVETCLEGPRINEYYLSCLIEIQELVKENKNIIFVTSPTYSDVCKEDNQLLSQLMIDLNLPYYDFSDFFSEDNDINYWRDKTHLSEIGATIFTNSFIDSIDW